ncbi:hypothetical protein LC724_07450 [Blautia sp. RD014234]|nr:hypothetical protein [Blautia parvula]
MGYKEVKDSIPDTLYVRSGNEDGIGKMLDNPLVTYPETLNVADSGTYRIPCSLLGVVPLKDVKVETVEEKWVSVCGMPIGLYMDTQGVLIVDTGKSLAAMEFPVSRPLTLPNQEITSCRLTEKLSIPKRSDLKDP